MDGNRGDSPKNDKLVSGERLPHKFCPYCGFRNEASMDSCVKCGKDISWIRIPEQIPSPEIIKEKPRSEPKRESIFSMRAILVFLLIFLLLVALIAVMIIAGKSKSEETGCLMDANIAAVGVRCYENRAAVMSGPSIPCGGGSLSAV
ncbi:MAG: hypothetical protein JXA49_00455 [Actinobacteria bacterium]|nr:hypothetical protein [Actinomycetota bacterium]